MSTSLGSPHGTRRRRAPGRGVLESVAVIEAAVDDMATALPDVDLIEGKEVVQAVLKDFSARCVLGYLVTVFSLVLVFIVAWNLVWRLPVPLPNDAPAHLFAEGRAWAHLERLQAFGPSLVGSKSNVAVSDYIESSLRQLQANVEALVKSGALKYAPRFEIEVQRPSGALNFDLVGITLTNYYSRLHNVIMRMTWDHHFASSSGDASRGSHTNSTRNGGKKKALLVNSHFDTGLGSPGAVDARSCNALMLEIARTLAYGEKALHHPVIMLFNGAEESLQEGSHGFITHHRWRHDVGSVLNFDSGGIGGPQILFQVGSGEYAELFASHAPSLHGSIVAQELFDTGLLQGDTDYRIFRDFGDIHGLDLAWYRDGYKYHTPRDDITFMDEGSLQHAGSNAIAYILAICSNTTKGEIWRDDHLKAKAQGKADTAATSSHTEMPDLLDAYPSKSQIIFYDFLSLFNLHYTKSMARIMHLTVISGIGYFLYTSELSPKTIARATGYVFGADTVAVIVVLLVAGFVTLTGKVMSWFANQVVIAFLYLPAIVIGWLLVHNRLAGKPIKLLFLNSKLVGGKRDSNGSSASTPQVGASSSSVSSSVMVEQGDVLPKTWQMLEYEMIHGVSAWAAVLLFLWAELGIGSAYFWLWTCSSALASLVVMRQYGKSHKAAVEGNTSMVPWFAYVCFVPSVALLYQVLIQIMAMAFPLSGRLPPEVPVEIVIGAIFTLLMMNVMTPFQPLLHRFHRYRGAFRCALVLLFVALIIASISFPYSPYRPKRVTLQHAIRSEPFKGHSGLDEPAVLFAVCDAGPIGNMVARLNEIDSRGVTPHRDMHDWDAAFPLSHFLQGYSLPAPSPTLHAPTVKITKDTWDSTKVERTLVLEVDYAGSEWSTLKFLGPLKRWNLTSEIPPYSIKPGYHVIRHIGEHGLSKWAVELTFGDQLERRFDVTATHFGHSPILQSIVQTLPDWTAPVSFITSMSHIQA